MTPPEGFTGFQRAAARAEEGMRALRSEDVRRQVARLFPDLPGGLDGAYVHPCPVDLLDLMRGGLPPDVARKCGGGTLGVLSVKGRRNARLFVSSTGCAARAASLQIEKNGIGWSVWLVSETDKEALCRM